MRDNLLAWQLEAYRLYHARRVNLLIHIVAVPAFQASFALLVWSLARLSLAGAVAGLLGLAVAFGAQAVGHGREAEPSVPFAGPGDAISRIFAEQFVTFPRFVLSGGWAEALRNSASGAGRA